MSGRQFSMRTLLVTVSLVAFYFGASRLYRNWFESAYSWYASSRRVASLTNGLSLDLVSSQYSSTQRINPTDLVDLGPPEKGKIRRPDGGFTSVGRSLIKLLQDRFEAMAPGDELYYFEDRLGGVYLQFHDGKLINHPRALYEPTIQVSKKNHFPFPNVALRLGILPYYIPIALLVLLVDYRLQQHKIRQPPKRPDQSVQDKV